MNGERNIHAETELETSKATEGFSLILKIEEGETEEQYESRGLEHPQMITWYPDAYKRRRVLFEHWYEMNRPDGEN